jgi:hypothetical protein
MNYFHFLFNSSNARREEQKRSASLRNLSRNERILCLTVKGKGKVVPVLN